jgi:hypothetical protein
VSSTKHLHDHFGGNLPVRVKRLWWQEKGLSYTASGYGKKIPTSYQIQVEGRWHRIYCCIFSNSGTLWIAKGGKEYIVSTSEFSFPD